MLFLQGVMFYIPHIIYKNFEGGKIKNYIDGLQRWVLDNNERSDKEHELAKNVVENIGQLKGWCLQLVAARTLYLVSKACLFQDCRTFLCTRICGHLWQSIFSQQGWKFRACVNFEMSFWCLQISQKTNEIFIRISALASLKRSDQNTTNWMILF